jgi:hypothetical protein
LPESRYQAQTTATSAAHTVARSERARSDVGPGQQTGEQSPSRPQPGGLPGKDQRQADRRSRRQPPLRAGARRAGGLEIRRRSGLQRRCRGHPAQAQQDRATTALYSPRRRRQRDCPAGPVQGTDRRERNEQSPAGRCRRVSSGPECRVALRAQLPARVPSSSR